jgi:hypothetical protein
VDPVPYPVLSENPVTPENEPGPGSQPDHTGGRTCRYIEINPEVSSALRSEECPYLHHGYFVHFMWLESSVSAKMSEVQEAGSF